MCLSNPYRTIKLTNMIFLSFLLRFGNRHNMADKTVSAALFLPTARVKDTSKNNCIWTHLSRAACEGPTITLAPEKGMDDRAGGPLVSAVLSNASSSGEGVAKTPGEV